MKTISKKIFYLLLLTSFSSLLRAQAEKNIMNDSTLIKETCANYVEGFYTNDVKRMEKAIHPELAKRLIVKDTSGVEMLRNMGSTELLYNTAMNKQRKNDTGDPFQTNVSIYDIFNDIATVKIVTNKFKFIDYAQLGKVNGEWKIINVLWAFSKNK